MTDTLERIKAKRLQYSRQVSSGAITWGDVPDQYVPEIFKMKRPVHETKTISQDEFCRMKDCRSQGFSVEGIAFDLRKEVGCVKVAWKYETFTQYSNRCKDTPWPSPMDL